MSGPALLSCLVLKLGPLALALSLQTATTPAPAKTVAEARALAFEGHYKEALTGFRQALAFDPDDALINYYVGITLLKMEEPRTARLYFRRSIDLKADFPEPYLWLGRVEDQLSEFESAQLVVRHGLTKFPRHEELLSLRDFLKESDSKVP